MILDCPLFQTGHVETVGVQISISKNSELAFYEAFIHVLSFKKMGKMSKKTSQLFYMELVMYLLHCAHLKE